jgi:hypothetical protein
MKYELELVPFACSAAEPLSKCCQGSIRELSADWLDQILFHDVLLSRLVNAT